jgi:predicted site-specific integrase-resolvase
VFFSEEELANRWLHSVRTLQRWRRRGTGPVFTRLGRRVVYRLDDVEAYEQAARRFEGSGR